MTSDQEAVCGTCGKADDAECATCRTQIHDIYRPAFCLADHHRPTIPAPVVPSDDERCAFPNSQWGVCGIPESAHADLMQPLAGSRFHHEFQRLAPPTPSQDAEGDGERAIERLVAGSAIPGPDWHDMLLMMQAHHNGEHDWSDNDPYDCTVCHVGIESFEERACATARAEVIREVEALRRDEIAWIPDTVGREAMAANRGWNKAIDAVLRALSQGGEGKA